MTKYNPKKKDDLRKVFNTVFVKDLPKSYESEQGVRSLFSPFGTISSVFPRPSEKGTSYFVCFGSDDSQDREAAPRSAEKAFKEMNGKILVIGEKPIYVNAAMNK